MQSKFEPLKDVKLELIRQNVLTAGQMSEIDRVMNNSKRSFEDVANHLYKLDKGKLYEVAAKGLGIEFVRAEGYYSSVSDAALDVFPDKLALKYNVMPIERVGNKLKVLAPNPTDDELKSLVEQQTGCVVTMVLGIEEDVRNLVWFYFKDRKARERLADLAQQVSKDLGNETSVLDTTARLMTAEQSENDSNPAIRLLNSVFEMAAYKKASDIHIAPFEDRAEISMRVDGMLTPLITDLPLKVCNEITTRIKVFCELKTDEKRKGQDGVLRYKGAGNVDLELRVSVLPVLHGESVVMRVVDKNGLHYDMNTLGLLAKDKQNIEWCISQPYGLILVTGPTGSGKTTTLYTALKQIIDKNPALNIITVEDPVEQQLQGIKQLKLNAGVGFGFEDALRGILRHDPDILLIGEIRDKETADIAVRAASTGHLVLSTLHTNDAVSAIYRLYDIGIEPFMLASVLTGSVAQRLVRKVCPHCGGERELTSMEASVLDMPEESTVRFGKGCAICNNSGYLGRVAVYETVKMDEELRKGIVKNIDMDSLRAIAQKQGMRTLRDNCRDLVKQGVTSPQEAIRVIFSKE